TRTNDDRSEIEVSATVKLATTRPRPERTSCPRRCKRDEETRYDVDSNARLQPSSSSQHGVCVAFSGGITMSVARVVEISSTSPKSFEDAIIQGVDRANKTLRHVKSAWVKEQEAEVNDGKVVAYKVNLKVTFVLDGEAV